jgi:hypothetical protein
MWRNIEKAVRARLKNKKKLLRDHVSWSIFPNNLATLIITTMMRMIIIMSLPTIKSQQLNTPQCRLLTTVLKVQTFVTNCCTKIIKRHNKETRLRTTPLSIPSNYN